MSLISTIQLAANSLQANQIGLQVVGQNVANANTPGYSKEDVAFSPLPTQRIGDVLLGLGVHVDGVRQQVDKFTDQRLRSATSDSSGATAQQQAYQNLEGVLGDLKDTNLSTSFTAFFSSIQNVLNQPSDVSTRNLAALQGQSLSSDVARLGQGIDAQRSDLDQKINGDVLDANRLIAQVRNLNVQISEQEGGHTSGSDAVGLRDQRNQALNDLSKLVDIRVQEDRSGATNVFVGGDYLIYQGQQRTLATSLKSDRGVNVTEVVLADTKAPLTSQSGSIAGEITARDTILGGFHDKLDTFARTLAFEFNKVFSSGQGLAGYSTLAAKNSVNDANQSLESVGLPYTPVSGTFDVQIYNTQTKLTQTSTIAVDLNGLSGKDTTLNSLAAQLNGVPGLSATVSARGQLQLKSTAPNLQFAFGNDTSGALASLGVNVFFTGKGANDLGVNADITSDPNKFAVSGAGVGADTSNGIKLAAFPDQAIDSLGGISITQYQSSLKADVAQGSAAATAVANGFASYQSTLNGQRLAISGVSIDEETVKLIQYQRAYQASAKIISTLNVLLDTLIKL